MIYDITKKLHENFPDHKIYTETIEQGFKQPCFLVTQLSGGGNREIGNRFGFENQFMVQFFPVPYKIQSTHTELKQCRDMLEKLRLLLIDVGNYHAVELNGTISDDVLNVECVYMERVIVQTDIPEMNTYSQNFKEKKGD